MIIYTHVTIKWFRERNNMTIKRAADLAGIKYQQWQRWENGKTIPNALGLAKICNTLGINALNLFQEIDCGEVYYIENCHQECFNFSDVELEFQLDDAIENQK